MAETTPAAAAVLNSVAPESTTAQLAGAVPLEKDRKEDTGAAAETAAPAESVAPTPGADLPGGFPVTPALDLDKQVGVNPLPATNGALNPPKGEEVTEVSPEDINKNVKLDKESYEKSDALPGGDQFVGVNPLPATEGALNPPKGEQATEDINKNVKLDQESYEKSDALPGGDQFVGVNPLPATEGALNPPKGEQATGDINKNVKLDQESYEKSDALPGGAQFVGVNPLPATEGALNPPKGEQVTEASPEDINKNVKLDKESYEKSDALPGGGQDNLENKTVSVNPLPAADFGINPIKLAPGEKVPGANAEDINKNVKLDKESYEKSDALPGLDALPPVASNTIPESSLPVTSGAEAALLNTVTPASTTAQLAGQVPLEPKVPAVVKESQEKAHVDPEASAIAEEVREKAEVEAELLKKVPEAPAAAESGAGAAAAAVPAPVKESIAEAGKDAPGAAADAGAVEDKKAVESELKKTVETTPAVAAAPAKAKPAAPAPAAAAAESKPAAAETNGAGASKADTAGDAVAKKKKHRISAIFSKIKKAIKENK